MDKFTELTKSKSWIEGRGLGVEEGRQRGALDKLHKSPSLKGL